MRIICTNRGGHDRPVIIRYDWLATDLPADADSHVFRCKRCGKAPRVSLSDWPRLVAEYEAQGHAVLDISYLNR